LNTKLTYTPKQDQNKQPQNDTNHAQIANLCAVSILIASFNLTTCQMLQAIKGGNLFIVLFPVTIAVRANRHGNADVFKRK